MNSMTESLLEEYGNEECSLSITRSTIAQAHAEYAELERRNAELVRLLRASAPYVEDWALDALSIKENMENGHDHNVVAELIEDIDAALTHSAQEEADG